MRQMRTINIMAGSMRICPPLGDRLPPKRWKGSRLRKYSVRVVTKFPEHYHVRTGNVTSEKSANYNIARASWLIMHARYPWIVSNSIPVCVLDEYMEILKMTNKEIIAQARLLK